MRPWGKLASKPRLVQARLGLKETQTRKYLRRVTAYCRLRLDGLTEAEAKEQVFP